MLTALLLAAALQDDARAAVERSLPFLERGGTQWMRDRKCASCHHVTFMLWSHREALGRGFAVDTEKLAAWSDWTVDFSLAAKRQDGSRNGGGLETMAQLILTRPAGANETPYRELAGLIAGLQRPDGSWGADGQLPSQRRPKDETDEASTRWVLLALDTLPPAGETARAKASAWLAARGAPKSSETLALRALASEPSLKELIARQNADGGWGFLLGEKSDALNTGQVLYLLHRAGLATDADPIRRARGFLVRTQGEDGSWPVPSTKAKPKDDVISTYWGSAWAAVGLLHTLPE